MNKKVVIIDYQMSNLYSVQHACEYVGLNAEISSDTSKLINADAAILPGVGAFGDAMKNMERLGLVQTIKDFVSKRKPLLGVCLGLQLLFSKSEEFGIHQGLDLIKGKVIKFSGSNEQNKPITVPQIGWNTIYYYDKKIWDNSLLNDLSNNEFMYFVHSYYVVPEDTSLITSLTNYEGIEYCSSIKSDNIFATQFHPEKSGQKGLGIYKNFANFNKA